MVCSEHSQPFWPPEEFYFDSHGTDLNVLFHEVLELAAELGSDGKVEASMEIVVAILFVYKAGFDFF